jgi:predicted branched-subunit amino acid permease
MEMQTCVPRFTRAGFVAGARELAPLIPGIITFGATFGALAAQKQFPLSHALAMSGVIYAGVSQLMVLQFWPDHLTVAALITLMALVFTVNARFILMGASMRPWLENLPVWQVYPALMLNTDPIWLLTARYRAGGRSDAGYFLGAGVVSWLVWVAATAPGYWLGAAIGSAERFGLDVFMPVFFAAMLVPLWRGIGPAVPWLVAGAAAVVASLLLPGYWFIVIGAVAGALTAAWSAEDRLA